jgi:hypothetical protein
MFSELVDRCVTTAGRPDQLANIVAAVNEAMRAISKAGDWPDDTVEETALPPANPADPFVWTPSVGRLRFRREEYITDAYGGEPTAVRPSRRIRNLPMYYYRSGDSFVFAGTRGQVKVYYYAYQPWLRYYPIGGRPTVFDVNTGEYTDDTPAVVALVSNWMLERHNSIVEAGALAKFFAGKQDPRQSLHYTIFQQGLATISKAEGINELLGRRNG